MKYFSLLLFGLLENYRYPQTGFFPLSKLSKHKLSSNGLIIQATCGTLGLSTATVKLIASDGEERIACSIGTGPVDAAYKAIDSIVEVRIQNSTLLILCCYFM